jgi:Holliday junction DNA helicase RuvA
MIGYIEGILKDKKPPMALVDVQGIGYELLCSMTTIYALPETNSPVKLLTHFVVREDAQLLYGFNSILERELFRVLIKVNGVGPKLALAVLSGMTPENFIATVNQQDLLRLTKVPGIGKKTAERLIVEIKDKLTSFDCNLTSTSSSAEDDAISALIALGYKAKEAADYVRRVYVNGYDSQRLIKLALSEASLA